MSDQRIREFPTEMWFRNPTGYIKELAEVGEFWLTWDYGLVKKTRLDPVKLCEVYFGMDKTWRVIIVAEWGAAEYRPGDLYGEPSAVYPVFTYGDSQEILEDILELPWGADAELCSNPDDKLADRVPIMGQEHRVVITNLPNMRDARSRGFLRFLAAKQQEFPECIVHLHGLTAFRPMFAYPFKAVDFEARTAAQGGRVCLPNGAIVPYERSVNSPQWLKLLNATVGELAVPRNRCMFNIRSAAWAAQYFRSSLRFRVSQSKGVTFPGMGNEQAADEPTDDISVMIRAKEAKLRRKVENGEIKAPPGHEFQPRANNTGIDTESSDRDYSPGEVTGRSSYKSLRYSPGDRVTCDTCSVARMCKVYREGSVCNVPQSPGEKLAKAFSSRDSSQIIDGLGNLLALQSERLETAMEDERDFGEMNPEVTKLMNSLFTNGTKLAKLVDPTLNGAGTTVNVGVGAGGSAQVTTANPNTIMAQIVRVLEDKGIPRDQITSDMVAGVLQAMNGGVSEEHSGPVRAIEGIVTKRTDS